MPAMRAAIALVCLFVATGCDAPTPPVTPTAVAPAKGKPTPVATPTPTPIGESAGHLDALGFFVGDTAPNPLACQADADCSGNTILAANGCCRDPRSLRAVAKLYDYWASARAQSPVCGAVTCPPPPNPSQPAACAIAPRCVAKRCVTQCVEDVGATGVDFELRIDHTESERSKDSHATRVVALVIADEVHWAATHSGSHAQEPRVERRRLDAKDVEALRAIVAATNLVALEDEVIEDGGESNSVHLQLGVGVHVDGKNGRYRARGTLRVGGRPTALATAAEVTAAEQLLAVLRRVIERK